MNAALGVMRVMNKYLLLLVFVSSICFSKNGDLCTAEAIDQYKVALANEVSSKIKYPKIAAQRGWEGLGIINFMIIDSVVFSKQITQTTGYQLLDTAIEDAINESIFPELACQTINKNLTIAAPIEFKLPLSHPTHPSSGTH